MFVTVQIIVGCCGLRGQPSSIVEQLKLQFRPTILYDATGSVSLVALEGTIVAVRQSGLKGNPEFISGYAPNFYTAGGTITQPVSSGKRAPRTRIPTVEDLPSGTRLDITDISATDSVITFNLQTCNDLHPGTPQKHRAALAFQFQPGYVTSQNLKPITDAIGEILTVVQQSPPVPGVYVNPANKNRIQLNADASFVAVDNGRTLNGRYSFNTIALAIQNKNNLQLEMAGTGATVFLGLQDEKITDQAGDVWVKQPSGVGERVPQEPIPLGRVYVSEQSPSDRLELNSNNTFSLREGGQLFSGTYLVAGTTLRLHIAELQKDVDIAIGDQRLIVNGSEVWIPGNR